LGSSFSGSGFFGGGLENRAIRLGGFGTGGMQCRARDVLRGRKALPT
jgi:hypothetical protein